MSSEILGEPPVVEDPTVRKIANEVLRQRSRNFARAVLIVAASLLAFGFFLGMGAGYSIWG